MIVSALTTLMVLHSTPALAQDPAAAAPPAPPAVSDRYAELRAHRSCQSILPPLAAAGALAPPPLCERAPAGTRCIAPHRKGGQQKRPNQVLDPEDENPPPLPPYTLMYTAGLDHAFSWLKSLNTCRFQAGSAVTRPTEAVQGEFQTDESHATALAAYEQAMEARASEVVRVQGSTEPLLNGITIVAALPIEDLGQFSPETGCFFPGPRARVQLDDYKSRDTIYKTEGEVVRKYRLVPRKDNPDIVIGGELGESRTLASAYFDDDTPKTDIVFQSHPFCVDAPTGNVIRAQRERNAVADFGIAFEAIIRFRLDGEEPQWLVSGEFVNRTQPELVDIPPAGPRATPRQVRTDRVITVRPDATMPTGTAPTPDPGAHKLPLDNTGLFGCQAIGTGLGAWWLGAALLYRRRRS